jgi:YidC/Oxa1 family membrane protein insertase
MVRIGTEELLKFWKASTKQKKLLKEKKCHPLYNIIPPFVMAPMFLSVFLAVERICLREPTCRGAGGLLWFMDLSSIDPTFMLPVLSTATWLLTIELGAAEPRTELMNQVRAGVRFAAAVMVPVTAALPSGVFVYWITSNIFSLFQIYILQRAFVRRFFAIPPRTQEQYAASNKPVTI